jgi:hypothetical protein
MFDDITSHPRELDMIRAPPRTLNDQQQQTPQSEGEAVMPARRSYREKTETILVPIIGTAPLVVPPRHPFDYEGEAAMAARKAKQDSTTAASTPVETDSASVGTAEIPRLSAETMLVPIVGTSPLIVHKWSEKAKREMLDKEQGRKHVREIRDPDADYKSSLYLTDGGGYGFPILAFKSATIGAARYFGKSVRMTELRQFLFFTGVPSDDHTMFLTPIDGEPRMREDMVRVGMNGTDLRYRAEFVDWSAVLSVTFVPNSISRNSVLSLIDAGGMGVGVGEWRPEKRGQNGTYALDPDRDVEIRR